MDHLLPVQAEEVRKSPGNNFNPEMAFPIRQGPARLA